MFRPTFQKRAKAHSVGCCYFFPFMLTDANRLTQRSRTSPSTLFILINLEITLTAVCGVKDEQAAE